MITTDESLLERVKRLDAHEAWREFHERYERPILHYGRKLGLSSHQAKDVLQETMMVLMRLLPGFDYDRGKGRFRNFLLTIVHRRALEALRVNQRHDGVSLDRDEPDGRAPLKERLPAPLDSAEERQALARWRDSLLETALDRIEEDRRMDATTVAIFRAYAIEQRPMAEVTGRFRVTENGVYQIKNRLMRRLKADVGRLLRDSGSE